MLDQPPHLLTRFIATPATSTVHRLLLYAVVVALLIRFCHFVYNDYHAFLALGPGGTPSTFPGYVRVSWVRVFGALDFALVQKCLTAQRSPGRGHADPEIIIAALFRSQESSCSAPNVAEYSASFGIFPSNTSSLWPSTHSRWNRSTAPD